jgi:hypothetical protein
VPIGDEIAMSDAIVKLFSIGNDIDRISKTAALDSKRFDIGLCTDKIESLYGEMLKH